MAVEATQTVTINGSINANGKGFRGGVVEQNTTTPGTPSTYRTTSNSEGAEKGESIAGPASILGNGAFGRGAPANGGGGGNAHNGGGGGGSNAGSGTWTGNGNPDNSNSNWTTTWNLESSGFASSHQVEDEADTPGHQMAAIQLLLHRAMPAGEETITRTAVDSVEEILTMHQPHAYS